MQYGMKNNEKILITGVNGLLGVNTSLMLLEEGFNVVGLYRDKEKFKFVRHNRLELIKGDISDVNCLNNITHNCSYVVHIAALTDQNLDYEQYYKTNVLGTKNIVSSCIKNKVKKIIYISTANVFGYGSLRELGNEEKTIKKPFNKSFYVRSKKEAQEYILSKKDEIEVVVLNPTFMIGGYDSKPSSGRIVLMGLKNRIIFCPPGGKNFVCVDDVSKGIINAIKKGRNGEAYLLANQNLNFYDFFKILKEITTSKFLIIKIPKEVLQLMGKIGSTLRMCGVKTDISSENMKALSINNFYSNEKALMELGLNFKPIEHGIRDAVKWFDKSSN